MQESEWEFTELFALNGLMEGRMVGGSKSGYNQQNPDNIVVFNANVITIEDKKVWHGDLDITLDEAKLKAIAKKCGKTLWVLYESDARFGKEKHPIDDLVKRAIWSTKDGLLEELE